MGKGEGTSRLRPGAMVDHFRLVRPLGAGGMAEVFLARDTRLGRKVALKVVKPAVLGEANQVERFLFEARATARFNHPHIVTIHAVGEVDSRPYVALEYLEGESLAERLVRDPPTLQEGLRIALAVAGALREAHANRILHRDLKPANIMLARDGRVRVLDFGLAGVRERREGTLGITRKLDPESRLQEPGGLQGLWGTPAYMAPEQWDEEPTTEATDVWAFGVLLFEMICGHVPFEEGSVVKQALKVCSREPAPAPDVEVPAPLAQLVADCLAKDPRKRPGAVELVDRLQALLQADAEHPVAGTRPFRGLLPFAEEHRHFFFGRETEIASFVERLRSRPVLPVIGPSGAGKSSFVQAGVIPRLRERGPLVVVQLRPGPDPLGALAARVEAARRRDSHRGQSGPFGETVKSDPDDAGTRRLAERLRASPHMLNLALHRLAEKSGASVLLFVDQLEELVTLVPDPAERLAFMQAICSAADDVEMPVRVVLTLREEFLSRLSDDPLVRDVLGHITVLRSPGPEALLEILTRPVEQVGHAFDDPHLPVEMIAEVQNETACLPLIQFTGQMLWERRDRGRKLLRRASYDELGGVAGALASHADGVLAGLSASEVVLARTILLRLVTPDGTRRIMSERRVLEGLDAGAAQVLKRLTAARLITGRQSIDETEGELELVHESLLVAWGRLARWREESRDELAFIAEVDQAAALWEKRGRRDEELWQGDALWDAVRNAARCTTRLSGQVRRFLEAGQRRALRTQRSRRIVRAVVMVVLAVLALVFAWKEYQERLQRAEAVTKRAEAQLESARSAYFRGDLLEARAKLRNSLDTRDSLPGRALWQHLRDEHLVWRRAFGNVINGTALSPDGRTVAVACYDHAVYLVDARTTAVRVLRGHRGEVYDVAFSPDGALLASAGGPDATVRVWKVSDGTLLRVLRGHMHEVVDVAFSPDGATVASTGGDTTIRLWDVSALASDGERSRRQGGGALLDALVDRSRVLEGHTARVLAVAFSPDGNLLASGGRDGSVRLWDLGAGGPDGAAPPGQILFRRVDEVAALQFLPDGCTLVTGGGDGRIELWDVQEGRQKLQLPGHAGRLRSLSVDHSGRLLASSGLDRTVRIWNLADGELQTIHRGHAGDVPSVSLATDGTLLASGSWDRTVRLWRVAGSSSVTPKKPRGHRAVVHAAAFDPTGRRVASAGLDGTIRLWDAASGRQLQTIDAGTPIVMDVLFSPDGSRLISGGLDGDICLWDPQSGRRTDTLAGHTDVVCSLDCSRDGRLLASASWDQSVRLWDLDTKQAIQVLRDRPVEAFGVAFSPDGRLLATGWWDSVVRLWQVRSGRKLRAYRGHPFFVFGVDFSPDGRTFASGGELAKARIWEVDDRARGDEPAAGTAEPATAAGVLQGHDKRIYSVRYTPDAERLVTGSEDGTVRVWDLRTGEARVFEQNASVNILRLSPDGQWVAAACQDGAVRVWNLETGRLRWHASVLLPRGDRAPLVHSHQGWHRVGDAEPIDPRVAGPWRAAVEQARFAEVAPDRSVLCTRTWDDRLEMWDLPARRRTGRHAMPGLRVVRALPGGCLALCDGRVQRVGPDGAGETIATGVHAVDIDPQGFLVATRDHVLLFDHRGRPAGELPTGLGVSAMRRDDGLLMLGRREGHVDMIALEDGAPSPEHVFKDVPSSEVRRILDGPMQAVIVGYADGTIGLWDRETGVRLASRKLHGPIIHLHLAHHTLYAVTELGDHLAWDLGVYYADRCTVLRALWKRVPVVWERGQPILARGSDHPCAVDAGSVPP